MTSKQRMSILLDRWPAACQAQAWDPKDRDLRLRILSEAVGRQISTMNDLDNTRDIDAIYAHLGFLASNVARTIETLPVPMVTRPAGRRPRSIPTEDTAGLRRRLLYLIRKFSQPLGGEPYTVALVRDKWRTTPGLNNIEDLDSRQLHQLMITLRARSRSRSRVPISTPENCPF